MKLNQNTIDTLKNFAGINTNILIKQGDELSTISTMRNIFAKAKISDQFTNEFGIYDLNEFLSAVSGFSKPELSLQDKYMTISSEGSKSKVKYFYSDPSVIVSPTKEVNMPDADVTFSLTESNYKELLKMAAILKSPDMPIDRSSIFSSNSLILLKTSAAKWNCAVISSAEILFSAITIRPLIRTGLFAGCKPIIS